MVRLSMGVSDMRKFIIRIALFFGIVAIVDVAIGLLFSQIHNHVKGGRTYKEKYVCEQSKDDILVLGSSRAQDHYIPSIITENIGMSCFNGGQEGNGIIMQYGRWLMIKKRYIPKLVVYDITTDFDLVEDDKLRYIDRLKLYADDKDVMNYIADIAPLERLKMRSQLYRYNYKFLEILSDYIAGKPMLYNGWELVKGQLKPQIREKKAAPEQKIDYDDVKLRYLEKLIEEVQGCGSKMIVSVSPYWQSVGNYDFTKLKELCSRHNVPFHNYQETELCSNPTIFSDSYHMNDKGAKLFTEIFCDDIKEEM